MGRKTWAALALGVAASAMTAAPAGAATVTVTGDAGTPVALAPGAPAAIRNMNVDVGLALAGTEEGAAISIAGPVAPASFASTCSSGGTRGVDYQGNGAYTISITTYTNAACTTGATAATYQYTVNASTAIAPPAGGKVLTRRPNAYGSETYNIPVAINPGALSTNLFYARGGSIGPDGAIAGPSAEGFIDSQTGTAAVRFENPGAYVMVARATGFTGAAGQFFSPWSAPVTVRAYAPFDFQGTPTFPDSRGPKYKLRAIVRERAARGAKVKISIAHGHKRGKFKTIGKAKIRGGGKITKKFRPGGPGKYRLKYRFKGNGRVLPGTYVQKIKITRRFI